MEAVFWRVRRPDTAHLVSGGAEPSCLCRLKRQVGVDATVSATEGILCAALVERMIDDCELHDIPFRTFGSL